jgi:hypothetical protein
LHCKLRIIFFIRKPGVHFLQNIFTPALNFFLPLHCHYLHLATYLHPQSYCL